MSYGDVSGEIADAIEKIPTVTLSLTDVEDLMAIANKAALLVEALNTRGQKPTAARRELERALERFFTD